MQAHRASTTVAGDGSVTVRGLPFLEGEEVDVIVVPRESSDSHAPGRAPLRGSVRRYERPFESATDGDDWEAA